MTDNEVPKGWWARQSSGTKGVLGVAGVCCIGLIVIVVLAGIFAPDTNTNTQTPTTGTGNTQTPTTGNTQTPASTNTEKTTTNAGENYIEVSYPEGSWDGAITIQSGNNQEQINFDGSGTKKFDLAPYAGKDVYVMAQKQDDSSGKLSAVIVRNGKNKLTQSTTEGYGIVSGWVFSWS